LRAFEKTLDFLVLLRHLLSQIFLAREFNWIINVLDIGFVAVKNVATKRLKRSGLLNVNNILVNTYFGANWLIAYNRKFDNGR
jgi:hypothetical protein